ncbi:unnamed protein product [Fusarium venenatum]|uniref:Uncharacterized protein n=1 Tax=Fusarium venenatum TaxID=56646 RepID=A0A2L2T983_9HYPO|nr:uncharacterized protein FVRRES_03994 [Fusarium venenatum]CEI67482.1 unnamed protein product [Fusarium venenatum]
MDVPKTSPEVVVTIIFGILQLILALVSLWQQHYLRWTNYLEEDEALFEYVEMPWSSYSLQRYQQDFERTGKLVGEA